MAYVQPVIQKQLQDLRQQQGPNTVLSTGGPAVDSTTSGQVGGDVVQSGDTGQQLARTTGNQFVNFGELVDANRGNTENYAGQIGRTIGVDNANSAISQAQTNFGNASNSGMAGLTQDQLNKLVSDPFAGTEGYDTLKSILATGGYSGPNAITDTYADARDKVSKAQEAAKLLGTDASSLTALLAANPTDNATQGGIRLDAALLSGTEGAQNKFNAAKQAASDLTGTLNTSQNESNALLNANKAQAALNQTNAKNTLNTGLENLKSQNNAELQALIDADAKARADYLNNAQRGNLAGLNQDTTDFDNIINGISKGLAETEFKNAVAGRNAQTNYSPYASWQNNTYTTGNVLNDAERARLAGLNSLLGLQDNYSQAAGSAGQGVFDRAGALAYLQGQQQAQTGKPVNDGKVNTPTTGGGINAGGDYGRPSVGGDISNIGGIPSGNGSSPNGGVGNDASGADNGYGGIAPPGSYYGPDGMVYDQNGVWQGPPGSVGIDPTFQFGDNRGISALANLIAKGLGIPGALTWGAKELWDYYARLDNDQKAALAFEKHRQEVEDEYNKNYGKNDEQTQKDLEEWARSAPSDPYGDALGPSDPYSGGYPSSDYGGGYTNGSDGFNDWFGGTDWSGGDSGYRGLPNYGDGLGSSRPYTDASSG